MQSEEFSSPALNTSAAPFDSYSNYEVGSCRFVYTANVLLQRLGRIQINIRLRQNQLLKQPYRVGLEDEFSSQSWSVMLNALRITWSLTT
jgi:hypothetical protein